MRINSRILIILIFLYTEAAGQEPQIKSALSGLENSKLNGYRGIWFELNQKYPYGDKYSGGLGTYTADHIPMAVYCPEVKKTFFVYGGTTDSTERHLLCMAGCFDHRSGKVSRPTVVCDKMGVNDPHDNPVIQVDEKGFIWVFVSGRGRKRPGFKYRSDKPWSVDRFSKISTEEMTYPQPSVIAGKGFINLFTKYTGVRLLYFETSRDGITWSEDRLLAAIREPGDSLGGHYQVSNSAGGKVGTFFNRHPNGNVDKRTDLYYAETSDMGETWTTADGTPLEIPLKEINNQARVINYQEQGLNVYISDMNFDRNAFPAVIYITSRGHEPGPGNSPYLWRFTRWNGSNWITSVIGESDHNYDAGSLCHNGDGRWLVIAPINTGPQPWGAGGEAVFFESSDDGKTWHKSLQVTSDSQYNHNYFRRPLCAHDPFYYFWADGNPDHMSISHLYFGDSKGNYRQLPYTMRSNSAKPVRMHSPASLHR